VQQIICDADLNIVNCVAKWPGSVHDSRILRESPLFEAFENNKPLNGLILGDSGYMLRDWLMTPILAVRSAKDEAYNKALCGTRCSVERCIGVLKRRWHCLHTELRVSPQRACRIICACVVLHNRAVQLRQQDIDEVATDGDDDDINDTDAEVNPVTGGRQGIAEQARVAAGKVARDRLIANVF